MCVLNSAYHSFFSLLLQGIWILTPLIKLIIHHEDVIISKIKIEKEC